MDLWNIPESTQIDYYPAAKPSDAAVVIFPGGGYKFLVEREGKGYAEYLQSIGVHAFVVRYHVDPARFPQHLLDARRGVRFVRAHAAEYGIDPQKIAVMGSSAGGHLAALVSTYSDPLEGEGVDEIDAQSYLPNAQILCYPALSPEDGVYENHGCYVRFLGEEQISLGASVDPIRLVTADTPQAFIFHTSTDDGIVVTNSYRYATQLHKCGVPVEMHIFPEGGHGIGLAWHKYPHSGQWPILLKNWLIFLGWIKKDAEDAE